MTDRPILFSAPMVRALLTGEKTQTRRIACLASEADSIRWVNNQPMMPPGSKGYTGWIRELANAPLLLPMRCPHGVPGDRLWVRETFALLDHESAVYRADCGPEHEADLRALGRIPTPHPWKPSIHMPRWASRIALELTSVRVQRLQDISSEDAFADGGFQSYEGCESHSAAEGWDPVDHFRDHVWEPINAQRPGCSWEANPWVWALTFKVVHP